MKNVFNNSPRKTNSLTQVCCSLVFMVAFASFLFGLFRTHLYSSSKPSIKKKNHYSHISMKATLWDHRQRNGGERSRNVLICFLFNKLSDQKQSKEEWVYWFIGFGPSLREVRQKSGIGNGSNFFFGSCWFCCCFLFFKGSCLLSHYTV